MTSQEYPFAARLMWVLEERSQLPLQFNLLLELMNNAQRLELVSHFNHYSSKTEPISIETLLTEIALNLNSYGSPALLQGILAYEGLLELLQVHYRSTDRELVAKAAIRGGQLEVLRWLLARPDVAPVRFEEGRGVLEMVPFGRVDVLDFVIWSFFAEEAASPHFDGTLLDLLLVWPGWPNVTGDSQPEFTDMAKLTYIMKKLADPPAMGDRLIRYAKVALKDDNMTAVELLLSRFDTRHRRMVVDAILEELSPQRLRYADRRPSREKAMETLEDYGRTYQARVLYLLSQGADPDQVLYFGASTGNLELVRAALEHGATDLEGALDDQAGGRYPEVARLLVAKGARSSRYTFDADFNVTRDTEEERYQRIWLRSSDEDESEYDSSSDDDYDPRDRYY